MTRLLFIQRGILDDSRAFWVSSLWSMLAVLAGIGLRFALAPWVEGLPFLTFFPVVLAASIFLGWTWGFVVTLASAAAANFFFVEPRYAWALTQSDVVGTFSFFVSAVLLVLTAQALRGTVREIANRAERENMLNAELQHRVKNNLAIVQSLARQTAKSTSNPDEFYQAFLGRLTALADAHNVLSSGNWEQCELPDLPQAALGPFDELDRITIEGPPCVVPPASCVPLVLALHELGTNALKYGSLSAPSGSVALTWTIRQESLLLRWKETGGPPVKQPTRKGLGSRLLTGQTGLDAVSLEYRPEGVICEMRIDGARLTA